MASSTKSAPEQPENPAPQTQTANEFRPIEVPVVDGTQGFTPIAVTPIDQAAQATTPKES